MTTRERRVRRVTTGPSVQIRTTELGSEILFHIAKREGRTVKAQSEILMLAGARALGYEVTRLGFGLGDDEAPTPGGGVR